MQATSLCSLGLPSRPPSGNSLHRSAPFVSHKLVTAAITVRSFTFICASKKDSYGHHYDDGKLVDENMIILRWRIREIEREEMKSEAHSDWSEWEKKYFPNYGSDVCDAVGLLQRMLMDTRPCLALGMMALIMLSMSISTSLIMFNLVDLAKGII